GKRCPALRMVEIIRIFCTSFLFAINDTRAQESPVFEIISQLADEVGLFRESCCNNVTRTVSRSLHISYIFVEILRGQLFWHQPTIVKDCLRQGSKAALAGNLSACAAFRLIWKIKIFQFSLCFYLTDFKFEFWR